MLLQGLWGKHWWRPELLFVFLWFFPVLLCSLGQCLEFGGGGSTANLWDKHWWRPELPFVFFWFLPVLLFPGMEFLGFIWSLFGGR